MVFRTYSSSWKRNTHWKRRLVKLISCTPLFIIFILLVPCLSLIYRPSECKFFYFASVFIIFQIKTTVHGSQCIAVLQDKFVLRNEYFLCFHISFLREGLSRLIVTLFMPIPKINDESYRFLEQLMRIAHGIVTLPTEINPFCLAVS